MKRLIIGTRGSALALRQTAIVLGALRAAAGNLEAEVRTMRTEGDRRQDVSLEAVGGQGVFVKDIEQALIAGQIDLAVHSLKDMPATTPDGLTIGAVLPRGDPRDVLVSRNAEPLAGLPPNARIGTDSQRRAVQLRALRHDVCPESIRGNVDTRIRKVLDGEYDAACLASAGLDRLDLGSSVSQVFSTEEMLPAVGQAVLAVECRADDAEVLELLAAVDDVPTRAAITAERAYLLRLGAGCRLPVAAYAVLEGNRLRVRALLASESGALLRDHAEGVPEDARDLGFELADRLLTASMRAR